jgi:fatty acid-binding protein DegV
MKNRIANAAGFVAFVIHTAKEEAAARKQQAAAQAEKDAYDAKIAEMQANIGPYVPEKNTSPVYIWG